MKKGERIKIEMRVLFRLFIFKSNIKSYVPLKFLNKMKGLFISKTICGV